MRFSKRQLQEAAGKAADKATRQEGRRKVTAFLFGVAFGVAAAWVFLKGVGL